MQTAYDIGYEDGWDDGRYGRDAVQTFDTNYARGYQEGYRDGKAIREVLNRVGE